MRRELAGEAGRCNRSGYHASQRFDCDFALPNARLVSTTFGPRMAYFVNIGSSGTNSYNKSGVGSRGYQILRRGRTVHCRWGGVTVVSRKFRWMAAPREIKYPCSSVRAARRFYDDKVQERLAGRYTQLSAGNAITGARPIRKGRVAAEKRRRPASGSAHAAGAQRAISIRQPFVELILRGVKIWEFRSVATRIRERVYLYASNKPFDDPAQWRKVRKQPGELPTGVIVGTVEITDCQDDSGGGFRYRLRNPRRLRTHLVPRNQPQPVFWLPQF